MERARHLLTYSTHSWIRLARLETCQWRTHFTKELSFVKTKKYTPMDTRTKMHTSTAFKAKNGKRNEGGNHKQTFIVYLTDFKLYKLDSNNLNHPNLHNDMYSNRSFLVITPTHIPLLGRTTGRCLRWCDWNISRHFFNGSLVETTNGCCQK